MKRLKKFAGILLAAAMTLTCSFAAFAAQEGELPGGKISINNAVEGQEYTIYQILYLESYNADADAYAYKANSAWESWLETQTEYVEIDDQGYVTWVDGADAETFAKEALKHARETGSGITADGTAEASDASVEFADLKLGYYLIDTSLGTLCSLDTTDPEAEIQEKNEAPTTEKEVQEDSDDSWGEENTAEIGDTVNFRTTITAQPGAENYVLHDEMSAGLTLNEESIEVMAGSIVLTEEEDYTVAFSGFEDDCDFEIAFTEDYLDSIDAETEIIVTYTAVLNDQAEIFADPNTNRTWLDYGDESNTASTPPSETDTYSFSFDIVKTDNEYKLLDGAEFELYDAQTEGNKIALIKEGDGTYRVATDKEVSDADFTSAVIVAADGQATVKGLDANTTYWLQETKAPDGYNKLAERVKVAVENANLSTTLESDVWTDEDGGVQITNISGALLPSTGGIGTTMFYVGGGFLMAGAAVFSIIKKNGKREE